MKTEKTFIFDGKKQYYRIQLIEKLSFFDRILGKKQTFSEEPKEGSRAFFSGLLISDQYVHNHISVVYKKDKYSEYVGQGHYPYNHKAFPNAVKYTFDGIAIDKNTRVIIYSKPNFKGKVLFNKIGPAIINNIKWKNEDRIKGFIQKKFEEPLQTNFPPACRFWSKTDMNGWSNGSVKVLNAQK